MIKQIFSTISSRLLFFFIGVCMAVSAGYLYAAWDDARTTGNQGELTENNWNTLVDELVGMDENVAGLEKESDASDRYNDLKSDISSISGIGLSCDFISVPQNACDHIVYYCMADKMTADKVCKDSGYIYAESYGWNPATFTLRSYWTGASWATSVTNQYALSYVYCCK